MVVCPCFAYVLSMFCVYDECMWGDVYVCGLYARLEMIGNVWAHTWGV